MCAQNHTLITVSGIASERLITKTSREWGNEEDCILGSFNNVSAALVI